MFIIGLACQAPTHQRRLGSNTRPHNSTHPYILKIMSESTRALILQHWSLANERRWAEFERLLAPDLYYEAPQTREYIESGIGYFEMFRTWPGNWKATIKQLICEDDTAMSIIDFDVGDERMTGISIFQISNGLICRVTDYWPDPYEPAPRATAHLKRRPSAA